MNDLKEVGVDVAVAVGLHAVKGQVMVSSLDVALAFGRQHKNVLRDIRELECSSEFNRLNYEPVDFIDKKGELQPCFDISRDGFAFLVMGYRGKRAAEFKEAYIREFNRMSKELVAKNVSEAIAGNVQAASRIGAWVRDGLTRWEWDELMGEMQDIADSYAMTDVEADRFLNAISSHFRRHFRFNRGDAGVGLAIPMKSARLYLRMVRAKYASGYKAEYKNGVLVVDPDMS